MRLGAHVSTSGGLDTAIDRAEEMGAEAVQIFASSPRMWRFRVPPEKEVTEFRIKAKAADVSPVFIHGSYLVNVGGTPDLVTKSIDSLSNSMGVASQIGAAGVIFHGGSHKGAGFSGMLGQATTALREVLSRSPDDVWLIIENSAGMGSHIGSSFREIGTLMKEIGSSQVMVCLDTQHSMAAGYNLADEDGIDAAMEEFDAEIGLSKLVAVHANDSKVEFGSGVDRHANIGEGHLGVEGFKTNNAPYGLQRRAFHPGSPRG